MLACSSLKSKNSYMYFLIPVWRKSVKKKIKKGENVFMHLNSCMHIRYGHIEDLFDRKAPL